MPKDIQVQIKKSSYVSDAFADIFGGLAATLVSLPSAIAFGILVFTPLGAAHAPEGALMGILGTIALGIAAPIFGGTPRLITAPCAPAAAVLATLTAEIIKPQFHFSPTAIPLLITLVIFLTGIFQFLLGVLGGGKLIKYVPFPVVDGYLSGVGAIILLGQIPKLFGFAKGTPTLLGIFSPTLWAWQGVAVGALTIATMLIAPKITRAIPASIIALGVGIATYFGLAEFYPELSVLTGNKLVIGPIDSFSGSQFIKTFLDRFHGLEIFSHIETSTAIQFIITPALTLAVLLSIDTLKTCVILDALTRTRHESNRELRGQGLGNICTSLIGGLGGAGTMGATLMNFSSGGQTRTSSLLSGVFALLTYLLLSRLVAWVPLAALAGILIVVAARMIDWKSVKFLKHRSTALDFFVVLAVILTAILLNLIAAAGVGVAFSILLFLREQIRSSVIRRKLFGNQVFSKKRRLPEEMKILNEVGDETVIFELQGPLFFGTTDQLFSELEPYLSKAKYVILDLKKVTTVDFTAAHLLEHIEARIEENKGCLVFSNLPLHLSQGQDLKSYFSEVGLVQAQSRIQIFSELDDALEWIEDKTLSKGTSPEKNQEILNLSQIAILTGLSQEVLDELKKCTQEKTFQGGDKIFKKGDRGDEIYFIRRGGVKILLPLQGEKFHHLATFSRGDFFGDLSFLDQKARSADAIASEQTELYMISRARFDEFTLKTQGVGRIFFSQLAHGLALRLRQTDKELRALEEA